MALNATALTFKGLHKPGNPLVLANVYDTTSAFALSAHAQCRALATASYAIAAANGLRDQDLTLDNYLPLLTPIAAIAEKAGKPLTVDLQDGYGERIEEAVRAVIALGAVGINLEDSDHVTGEMMGVETAVERIKRALQAAREERVPDFVINARSDAFMMGAALEDAVQRGKQYLEAGATTVYVFPGPAKNIDEKGVEMVVKELGGMVNLAVRVVGVRPEDLTSKDLARLGVARISVGPQLYLAAAQALKATAELTFQGVV
jgi:2-methylisocitrate lyase-like PEP mutase family enzyme